MSEASDRIKSLLDPLNPEQVRQAYKREYNYLVFLEKLDKDYGELIQRFPEEDEEARSFLFKAHARGTSSTRPTLLNHEEIDKLREENPRLYSRIFPVFRAFLAEKSGIKK